MRIVLRNKWQQGGQKKFGEVQTIGYLGLVIYYLVKGAVDLVRVNQLIKEKGPKSPQVKAALKNLWNDDLRPVLTNWLEAFPSLKFIFYVPPRI